jgi:hypothetical protein
MVFNEILNKLKQIHIEMPDLNFGEIVQNAIDTKNKIINNNLNNLSNKKILTSIEEYYIKEKNKRI